MGKSENMLGEDQGNPTSVDAEGEATSAGKDGKKFTQVEVDAIIKERLERERRKQEEETRKAKETAERDAMIANQEWKKLAEDQTKKVEELSQQYADYEDLRSRVTQYETVIGDFIKGQMESVPEGVQTLLEKLPVLERLEWLTKNGNSVLGSGEKKGPPSLPLPERKDGSAEDIIAKKRRSGMYSGI